MTDHSQLRRFPPRQLSPRQDDEQDGDALLADDDWPPRTHTSAVRYQTTTNGTPGTALVRTTMTGQRMRGIPARQSAIAPQRTAMPQRLLPAGRDEQEPCPPSRRGGHPHFHWLVYVGLGMLIALNLKRHVLIIELPAGDASKARIYGGPILLGQGQDLTPVSLSFRDVNGDGKPDMLVWVADSHFVFLNDGSGFRPARLGEAVSS